MRIVHVANTNYKYLGLRNYGLPIKINNGFIRNGHDVYWYNERDVARASNILGTRKLGKKACNRKLLQVCQNFEPEVLALAGADMIHAETIDSIRRHLPHIIILLYDIDALYIDSNVAAIHSKRDHVDHIFLTTGGACLTNMAGKNAGVSFIPNPVDPSVDACKNHLRRDLPTDIMFAGAINKWVAPDDLRMLAPGAIRNHFPNLNCEFYGNDNKIWGAEFRKAICRSKIGLNFSCTPEGLSGGPGSELYLYSSDRISLYMGNGMLTFTSAANNLSELYGHDRIVEVKNVDEFIDRVRFFTENDEERMRVAQNGYDFVHSECNERLVAQYMIEVTSGQDWTHDYVWPTEVFRA